MILKTFAAFIAPLITAIIAFLLNKYFRNKPKLIAYYGNISVHKVSTNRGYQINTVKLANELDKGQLDFLYKEKIPLLIQHEDSIWIYGIDEAGHTKLTKTSKKNI